jgi:hypothetical protein
MRRFAGSSPLAALGFTLLGVPLFQAMNKD